MKKLLLLSSLFYILSVSVKAQGYCAPAFINGCFSWQTQAISCNNLNWYSTGNCEDFDFTTDTVRMGVGVPVFMTVTNGNWCGASVWVDFNNDFDFDDAGESMIGQYLANEINNYAFQITIPSNTPEGDYRMRVISSWGSDGITIGGNGDGGCGNYQYGNYSDFTLNVAIANSIADRNAAKFSISPNPAQNFINIYNESNSNEMNIMDVAGKVVLSKSIETGNNSFDVSSLSSGIYTVKIGNTTSKLIIRQ